VAEAARPLLHLVRDQIVSDEDGEILGPADILARLRQAEAERDAAVTQVQMLERDLQGKRLRIAHLEADEDAKREDHERREDIERVWRYWQKRCNHPRAQLDNPTFFAIAALMKLGGKRTPEFKWPDDYKAAIDGAAYDAFEVRRRNGTVKRHDDLGLIFRDAAHMREFIAKAPQMRDKAPQTA